MNRVGNSQDIREVVIRNDVQENVMTDLEVQESLGIKGGILV